MISISSPTFDLNGNVVLQQTETSDVHHQTRRVSRSKTLDGGVSAPDMGFSHGDRSFSVTVKKITRELFDSVSYLQKNYPRLVVAIHEGCFLGAILSISLRDGSLLFTFLVTEKLTED